MSGVTLESVKRDLRIIHDDDDVLLQELIDANTRACLNFLDFDDEEASSETVLADDALYGIRLMVRAAYEETDPTRLAALRAAAESFWMPYRTGLGV